MIRDATIHISGQLVEKLIFVSIIEADFNCADALAETLLTQALEKCYPNLDKIFTKARTAKKAILDEARKELIHIRQR